MRAYLKLLNRPGVLLRLVCGAVVGVVVAYLLYALPAGPSFTAPFGTWLTRPPFIDPGLGALAGAAVVAAWEISLTLKSRRIQ